MLSDQRFSSWAWVHLNLVLFLLLVLLLRRCHCFGLHALPFSRLSLLCSGIRVQLLVSFLCSASFLSHQALRWRSFTKFATLELPHTLNDLLAFYFNQLESTHGKALVSQTMPKLAAAVHGLSDLEVEELLCLEEDVLDEVYDTVVPPLRRIPQLTWPDLKDVLDTWLIPTLSGSVPVNRLKHAQVSTTSANAYNLFVF
jgi:hypothetical protein